MTLTLMLFMYLHTPEHRLKLTDISIGQAVFAIKLSTTLDLPKITVAGKIKSVTVLICPHYVIGYASGFYILGDPVKWVRIGYNRTNRMYHLKAEALGGLIELDGLIPPS